ncbi:MAG: hypothetical protein ACXWDJ_11270 [Aeromicrobium sp.]
MSAVDYANVKHQRTVDCGYSGPLLVTCADGKRGTAPLVFIDGDWLPTNLVLSAREARELGYALMAVAQVADRHDRTDELSPP